MIDDDVMLEYSPLSATVTEDGISLDVSIYRRAGTTDDWTLEVVDSTGWSTMWETRFASDAAAFREFVEAAKANGFASFLSAIGETKH